MRLAVKWLIPLVLLTLVVAACGGTPADQNGVDGSDGLNGVESTPMDGVNGTEPLTGTEPLNGAEPTSDLGGANGSETMTTPEATTGTGMGEEENTVYIRNFAFEPVELTIPVGTTVTWINEDTAPHTATAGTPDNPTGEFDSGTLQTGDSWSYTFDTAGTFDYFCTIHPDMLGTIIVQ